jgi:hypothetical protein
LRDVYALDDLAFRTDSRKLQLAKVISLARLDPVAFQQLRETGVLRFATPTSLFDRDFPGHYLRLIRRVRTSIVALIPPSEGIRATLTSSGVSRVVIGNETFDAIDLQRGSESVALSSPINATGTFELDTQTRLLAPFEGIGVDTQWELELPRAANPFDFDTIADVLFTIEYTALQSNELRARVIKEREPTSSVDRAFNFRSELADQWYDLYHPEALDTPFSVTFCTGRQDFPPNLLEPLSIEHVALYFSRLPSGPALTPFQTTLQFRPDDGAGVFGGTVTMGSDGLVSTRRGNTPGWSSPSPLSGQWPIGEWTLSLSDNAAVRQLFSDEPPALDDILFMLTVGGSTPS